jgi:hypothetical protein
MDNWKCLIENSEKVITYLIYALGDSTVTLQFKTPRLDCQITFNVFQINKRGDLKDIEIKYVLKINDTEKDFKEFWITLVDNHLARAFLQEFIKDLKQRIMSKHGISYDQLDIENLPNLLSEASFLAFRAIDVLEKNEIVVNPNEKSEGPEQEQDDLIPPPKIKQGEKRKKDLDEFKKAQVDAADKAAKNKSQPPPTGVEAEEEFDEGDTYEMKE